MLLLAVLALSPLAATTQVSESDASVGPAEIDKADFYKPGIAPVDGPATAEVTIVYFMDYQCPQCRRYTPDVERAKREERGVRWIYRDIPNIGPKSRDAARLAIASQWQGRHRAFHHALMTSPGRLSDDTIREAAAKAGVDWARLQRDLANRSREIDALLAHNAALADWAGIVGTPAFLIGETLADGALDYKGLKAEIADARARARGSGPAAADSGDAPREADEPSGDEEAKPIVEDEANVAATASAGPAPFERAEPRRPQQGHANRDFAGAAGAITALLAAIAGAFLLLRRRNS
ncbi:thioredoxin domain-containing protein [Sphingomonas xanthus]|uniref:DsbA family protein n=1 Tax=Sphingomonas xanthus TaxID=2594473 RepID=A0A516IPY5_9SPHN|nr:thioredoxin domain-containing protein [Sphingomonas xanthus]QDP18947.1 DsbA family protein [Sphingomonas xanthus]